MNKDKKAKFLNKHKALKSKQAVQKRKQEIKSIKKSYAKDNKEVMNNLMTFFNKSYPLFDPKSGNEIAKIRKPSVSEIERMVPTNVPQNVDLEKLSMDERIEFYEKNKRALKQQFEVLSDIIVVPKQNAEWWEDHAGPLFLALVQQHITDILTGLAEETKKVENFQ